MSTSTLNSNFCSGREVAARRVRAAEMLYAGSKIEAGSPIPMEQIARTDVNYTHLDDDSDPRECVEFLRACVQQSCEDWKSLKSQTLREKPRAMQQLDEMIAQDPSAIPLWIPLCESHCPCYENVHRASCLCLQHLTGHRNVHRWCAGRSSHVFIPIVGNAKCLCVTA